MESNTVKDLMENEELNQFITEDLEDFETDAEVSYEVWALGYDEAGTITDSELFIKSFNDPDEAITFAKNLDLSDIVQLAANEDFSAESFCKIDYISVEVETVVDEEDGTMNIGTIYKKEIHI
jgi:hypothetical protein